MSSGKRQRSVRECCVLYSFAPLLAVLLWPGTALGVEAQPQPHIVDPVYRFPEMVAGGEVHHGFAIVNPADAPLRITRVRTSCGCTAGNVEPETIAPHGEGKLEVVFRTAGRTGVQRKHIFVSTDSPQTPLLQCSLEGDLLPPVTSVPVVAKRTPAPTAVASDRPEASVVAQAKRDSAEAPTPTPPKPTTQPIVASPDGLLFLNVPAGGSADRSFALRGPEGQAFHPIRVTAGCSDLTWRFVPLATDQSSWQVVATYQAKGHARRFQCQGRVILDNGQSVPIFLSGNTLEATVP